MEKIETFTKAALKTRGWSEGLIVRLLGDPDREARNPFYKSAAPMLLWEQGRVLEAEKREEFQEHLEKRKPSSERMKSKMEEKRQDLFQAIETMTIEVKVKPIENIKEAAIQNWIQRSMDRGHYEGKPNPDKQTLDRWSVNYIRHRLTKYDRHLEELAGKVGKQQGVLKIQRKVFDAIAEAYPVYRLECERQFARKQNRPF